MSVLLVASVVMVLVVVIVAVAVASTAALRFLLLVPVAFDLVLCVVHRC